VPCKRAFESWSAWEYEGGKRGNERAIRATLAVVEYDGTATVDDIRATWSSWTHAAHTTWSHKDADRARMRVILPLERAVTPAEWAAVWASLVEVDGERIDRQCPDAGRLWFLPRAREGQLPVAWCHRASLYPVSDTGSGPGGAAPPATAPRAPWKPPHPTTTNGRRFPISERYRTDTGLREAVAQRHGARVCGEGDRRAARDATCPHCAQASVWWWIEPSRASKAKCKHVKSCGWEGWLDQLDQLDRCVA
jgi:hypothetical protein